MKKKITPVTTQNETNITSLESYAKAFIREALISKTKKTDAIKMIQDLWAEAYVETFPLEEETLDEKAFREKARTFLNKHNEKIEKYINSTTFVSTSEWSYLNNLYSKTFIPVETSIFLEVLCSIYKAFNELESVAIENIVHFAKNRLDKIYAHIASQNKQYIELTVQILKRYISEFKPSQECLAFIEEYECPKRFDKFICRLIWEIENC